jgi:hemolysin activation/secretion protein
MLGMSEFSSRRCIKYPLLIFLLAIGNGVSFAVSPNAPDSMLPGAILQYNTRPWAIPQQEKQNNGIPSNQAPEHENKELHSPVELEKPVPIKTLSSKLFIHVKDIHLEDMTVLPSGLVEEKIKPYRNREITFEEVQKLADELTGLYVKAGYINCQVYIPPQDLKDHILLLKALEVKVGKVELEPGRWFHKQAILPQMATKPGDVLNIKPLSASIRRINDNPDLMVQARLVKGQAPGTTDIVLHEKEKFPVHVTPFWDNLGRRNIGVQRLGMTVTHNNLLGLGDINTSSFNFTTRSFGLVNQYSLPVGAHGTQVGLDLAYSHVKLGGTLEPLKIHSSAKIFSPVIRQDLWRSARGSLNAQLAFDFKDLNTDIQSQPLHRDRLRVLRPGINGTLNDAHGRTYFNQEVGIGLNLLGGSSGDTALASKAGSGTQFLRLTGGLTRVQKLPWGTTGVLRSHYQYTRDRLVSAEQIQMGGAYTVRGYQEGRQIGDKGFSFSAEWYVPCFLIPPEMKLPRMSQPLRRLVQVVGFTDVGQVYTNRPVASEIRHATLMGAGVGLRIQLTRFVVARVDLGFPLIRQEPYQNHARLHFGLQSALF